MTNLTKETKLIRFEEHFDNIKFLKNLPTLDGLIASARTMSVLLERTHPDIFSSVKLNFLTQDDLDNLQTRTAMPVHIVNQFSQDTGKINIIISDKILKINAQREFFEFFIIPTISIQLGFDVKKLPENLFLPLLLIFTTLHEFGHAYHYIKDSQEEKDRDVRERTAFEIESRDASYRFEGRKERKKKAKKYRNLSEEIKADTFAINTMKQYWQELNFGLTLEEMSHLYPLSLLTRLKKKLASIRAFLPKKI